MGGSMMMIEHHCKLKYYLGCDDLNIYIYIHKYIYIYCLEHILIHTLTIMLGGPR